MDAVAEGPGHVEDGVDDFLAVLLPQFDDHWEDRGVHQELHQLAARALQFWPVQTLKT